MLLRHARTRRGHLQTQPQRRRARTLVALLVVLFIGLVGHVFAVYHLAVHDNVSTARAVTATVVTSPSDAASGIAWSPMGSVRFVGVDGHAKVLTTDLDPSTRDGQHMTVWITPASALTNEPTHVSPWSLIKHTTIWALLAAAAALGVVAWVTRPLVRFRERRLFDDIVTPIKGEAAGWMRDWD